MAHNLLVSWTVELADEFEPEYENLPNEAQDELLAMTRLLQRFGPQLKRPHADTMNGSRHANMKELRFNAADGVWRVAFSFDPQRRAVLLVAGDKPGDNARRIFSAVIQEGG